MQTKTRVRRRKKRRSRVNRALIPAFIVILLLMVIGIAVVGSYLFKKYTPSKERADVVEYFSVEGDQVAILLNNEKLEIQGKLINGEVYVDTNFLYDSLNSRFYWDSQENLLLYTTPTEIITAEVGSKDYLVGKNKETETYVPVKADGSTAYVALAFIEKYTALDYTFIEEDAYRVLIYTEYGDYPVVTMKKDAQVRDKAGIKRPILSDVEKGFTAYVLEETDPIEEWTRVCTKDGYIGYVKDTQLVSTSGVETMATEFEEPEYTNISKDYTINMAWHQVTNRTANSTIYEVLPSTKGLTTISPTWFYLKDDDGNIESIASQEYVDYCHQNDVEVWALVEDITYADTITNYNIFSRTSSRQRLVSNLIAQAIQYDLDGLNIDCEYINTDTAKGYVQFLRELSIMCRVNGIILSIDNYVPADYNAHYNRKEQGIVADYVIIMGYDEHHGGSQEAGSVASYEYVKKGIEDTLKVVPAEKVINAVPFYTRLWATDTVTGEVSSQAYGMNSAQQKVTGNGAEKYWIEEAKQYYAEYQVDSTLYQIWLEEEESIEQKANLIKEYNLAGISAWKLGFERNTIWDVILRYVN